MNKKELLSVIEKNIFTTELMVTEAKIFLVQCRESSCQLALDSLMKYKELSIPPHLDMIGVTEQETGMKLAKAISWRNAGAKALWILQGQGICIPTKNELSESRYYVRYTAGSSHQISSGDLEFGSLLLHTFKNVNWAICEDIGISNSDVFLNNVDTKNLSDSVSTDLRQSVECFRQELYLPCLVMLGRAVEGAWIHVGESITQVGKDKSTNEKLLSQINDPYIGIAGKVNYITEEYKKKSNFGKLHHHSQVTPKLFTSVKQWSEQILEYRNAIHPKAEQVIRYNYENVSVVLLSVKSNFALLDSVVAHASSLQSESNFN